MRNLFTSTNGAASSSAPHADDGVLEEGEVPPPVVFFTCWVCTGIMANFTVVMPLTVYWEGGLLAASGLISSYAVGAIISLTFWSRYNANAIKPAYLTHATVMCLGNLFFAATAGAGDAYLWWIARFFVGLEGGCMYNANVALLTLSSKAKRVKYLSYYQSFVGLGLVLGPAISATATAFSYAVGVGSRTAYTGGFMSAWGFCLFVALCYAMPSDAEVRRAVVRDPKDTPVLPPRRENDVSSSSTETTPRARNLSRGRAEVIFLASVGNFFRIFQRLAWEVGAVYLLARYFKWGVVAAGYSLSFYGLCQSAAQSKYASHTGTTRSTKRSVRDLNVFEICEIIAVLGTFSKSDATGDWLKFFNVTYLVFSLGFYLASCLTSAPLNDLLLVKAARCPECCHTGDDLSYTPDVLLSAQYGIFAAFFAAPVVARAALAIGGVSTSSVSAVLVVGWAGQTLVNGLLVGRVESSRAASIGIIVTLVVAWAAFDRGVGGTGVTNVFSWHPVGMALAFFGFMTPGQYVYRNDAFELVTFVTRGLMPLFPSFGGGLRATREASSHAAAASSNDDDTLSTDERRSAHMAYMVSASVAAVAAYFCIFAAHAQSGESQVGAGESPSRAAHVAMGYLALLWLATQSSVGAWKAKTVRESGLKVARWHGMSGKYLLLFAYVTATLGFYLRMNYAAHESWSFALKASLTGASLALVGYRLFPESMYPPHGIDEGDSASAAGLDDAAADGGGCSDANNGGAGMRTPAVAAPGSSFKPPLVGTTDGTDAL